MKKTLSLLLALCTVISFGAFTVSAKFDPKPAPPVPVLLEKTDISVEIVETQEDVEYAIVPTEAAIEDGFDPASLAYSYNTRFRYLQPFTSYTVFARYTYDSIFYHPSLTSKLVVVTYNTPRLAAKNQTKITGLSSSYKLGDTVVFTAVGSGLSNHNPSWHDTRYVPVCWSIVREGGEFDATGSASFVIEDKKTELIVTFRLEQFDGTSWVATEETFLKTQTITAKLTVMDYISAFFASLLNILLIPYEAIKSLLY